jgi:hypothetical protein
MIEDMGVVIVIAVLVMLGLSYLISRSIASPIIALTAIMHRHRQGHSLANGRRRNGRTP